MDIISLFSGAGGFDQGFKDAGFQVLWANDVEKKVQATYQHNHQETEFCNKSIVDIQPKEIPDCDGIIGGPPCQSWSIAGAHGGIKDPRGKLFLEFVRIIEGKKPKFFIAENVKNITSKQHIQSFRKIRKMFREKGYILRTQELNSADFHVPQDRKRVFIVGIKEDEAHKVFRFPRKRKNIITLEDAIGHLKSTPPLPTKNHRIAEDNHEYLDESFSSIFMSRNRVRGWNETSFTILAQGRQMVLHPQAPKMSKVDTDIFEFQKGSEHLYRRFSVREAALIQSFPREFTFFYTNIKDAYKMVGNAVPPKLAYYLAMQIQRCFDI